MVELAKYVVTVYYLILIKEGTPVRFKLRQKRYTLLWFHLTQFYSSQPINGNYDRSNQSVWYFSNLPNSICFVSRKDISQKLLLSMKIISLLTFYP